jgi:type I restriction enzyme S subunit
MKKGWETRTLGEVSAINYGYTESASSEPVGPRFLRITDIQNDRVDWESVPYCKIDKADLPEYRLAGGDIVFARTGATTGKSFLVDDPPNAVFASYLIRLRLLDKNLLPEFVSLFFQTGGYWQAIKEGSAGSAQGGFSATKLGALSIPVPPLAEQQRIVGVLDEAFAGLATAQANAEKNLQNARALFESHLQSVFTHRGKGWVEKTVKDIAAPFKGSIRTGPFGSQLLHSEFVDEGIAVLGIDNAVANEFRWGKSRFITPEKYRQLKRYTVQPGDVLITIMGTCGRCAIVPDDIPTAINTKHICCITLDRKQCLPGYLHRYFLHAPQSQEFLAKHAKGAIMAGLNMGLIQELPVMLPSIQAQAAMVEAANALAVETQRLTRLYEQKQAALAALKKSLLHQAFSGEL